MDGAALIAALSRILSGDQPAAAEAAPWRPDREPGALRLLLGALRDHLRAAARLPGLVRRSWRGGKALKAHVAQSSIHLPVPSVDTPRSSLNAGSGPGRHFARAVVPLGEVRLVKDAAGVTVNDVAMALCSGALRTYLEERGDLPARPLVACVPVGLERPGQTATTAIRTSGNQWAIMTAPLATDVAEPWARLESMAATTLESKLRLDLLGRELLRDWTDYLHPWVAEPAAKRLQAKLDKRPERGGCNVTVSNLRGPAGQVALGPAIVEELYLTGPPSNRVGAVFVLTDLGEQLHFGILTVAGSVDDPASLAAGLQRELRALVKIVEGRLAG